MVVAPDLVLRHQVPVDVVQLRAPFPQALHIAHDATVLRSDKMSVFFIKEKKDFRTF